MKDDLDMFVCSPFTAHSVLFRSIPCEIQVHLLQAASTSLSTHCCLTYFHMQKCHLSPMKSPAHIQTHEATQQPEGDTAS